jgi:hypothetical protein
MTGLRVFEDAEGRFFLELTAPELAAERALFVPALPQDSPDSIALSESARVTILFRQQKYFVPYLLITSLVRTESTRRFQFAGLLEATDSINVLNHLVDLLAYPSA